MIQVIASVILLAGIATAVILVQKQQILKSRATNEIFNGFEVTNGSGQILPVASDAAGVRTYQTDDLNVNIKIRDINALLGD